MRKLRELLSSRLFWFALSMILQLALLFYVVMWASFVKGWFFFFLLLSIVLGFYVFSRPDKPDYKIVWLFLICILPLFGGVLYLTCANKRLGRFSQKKLAPYRKQLSMAGTSFESAGSVIESVTPEYARLAKYLKNKTGFDAWTGTECQYFTYPDEFFLDMLEEVRKAKKTIFMEYFIIAHGCWWDPLVEILEEKVREGVDVRLVYDDMGSISVLPKGYEKTLQAKGIKCVLFNPVRLHLNPRMNFRDHRKIFCIDSNVCYTGGLNIADEYSNDYIRFGYWKDNAIKLKGSAVWNFTYMFLEMWMCLTGEEAELSNYLPTLSVSSDGIVLPFGDNPMTNDTSAEDTYLQIIQNARKYVWITTPYLIPDDAMTNALTVAAQSGVDVRIILPHYPDKKTIFEVTQSNYEVLLKSGVRLYSFTPGFIHSKMFLADDEIAVVGTTNLDYRAFYLHFELSCVFILSSILGKIKDDFQRTFEVSEELSVESLPKLSIRRRIYRYFLKLFSAGL